MCWVHWSEPVITCSNGVGVSQGSDYVSVFLVIRWLPAFSMSTLNSSKYTLVWRGCYYCNYYITLHRLSGCLIRVGTRLFVFQLGLLRCLFCFLVELGKINRLLTLPLWEWSYPMQTCWTREIKKKENENSFDVSAGKPSKPNVWAEFDIKLMAWVHECWWILCDDH